MLKNNNRKQTEMTLYQGPFPNQRAEVYWGLSVQHPQICTLPATGSESPEIWPLCGASKGLAFSMSTAQFIPLQSLPRLITGQHSPMSDGHHSSAFWLSSSQRLGGLSFERVKQEEENEANLCKCIRHKSDYVCQIAQMAGVIFVFPLCTERVPYTSSLVWCSVPGLPTRIY